MIDIRKPLSEFNEAAPLAGQLGVHSFFDDRTFLSRRGDVGAVLRAGTLDMGCADMHQREENSRRMALAATTLPEGCRLHQYVIKRRDSPLAPAESSNPAVRRVEEARFRGLAESDTPLFAIDIYVVIVLERRHQAQGGFPDRMLSAVQRATRLKRFVSESTESTKLLRELKESSARLHRAVRGFISQLSDILVLDELTKQDIFEFLRVLVNDGRDYKTQLRGDGLLAEQVADSPVECHRDHLRVGDDFVQVLTLKEPPSATVANILASMQRIHAEWTVVSEWKRLPQADARKLVVSKRRHHHATKGSLIAAFSSSPNTRPEDILVDGAAENHVRELGKALEQIEAGRAIGEYSLSIVIRGPDLAAVKRAAVEFLKVFAVHGGALIDERFNLFNAWLATIPGNQAFNFRRLWMFDTTYGDMSLLAAPNQGEPFDAHLNKPALATFQTAEGTPFHFNLHRGDVAHCAILGSSGAGKSFLLNFLLLSMQKYLPIVYVFDLGGSYRNLTQFFGGAHCRLGTDGDVIAVNPFCLPPTPDNLQFLYAFVCVLMDSGDGGIANTDGLYDAIVNLYELEPAARKLSVLAKMLSRAQGDRLARWCEGGQFGWLFDNAHDQLTFSRFQTFDFQGLDRVPDLLQPLLFYVLHRASQTIEHPSEAATFKCFVIDEAWRFFRHPTVRNYIIEAAKTWRKKNAALILATQSGDDLLRSEMLPVINETCHTKLFLSNPGMDRDAYRQIFHLNETEAEAIATLTPKKEFLMKRPEFSKILELNVDPLLHHLCANVSGPVDPEPSHPNPTTRSNTHA